MSTNRVALKSIEQFMADFKPSYVPIFSAFLGNSQSYSDEAGKISFNRLDAVGNIRNQRINPKTNVLHSIQARESSKTFKKYFLASEYSQSSLQDPSRVEQVNAQVLEENNKLFDDLLLLGEGTSNSTMVNNGLFWSNDPNYSLTDTGSEEIDGDSVDPLIDFHAKIMVDANVAKQIDGKKLIMFYGSEAITLFNSVYAASNMPFKKVLQEVLGPDFSLAEMPTAITPASEHGWAIFSLSQIKMHYCSLPKIAAQGVDERKMEIWTHYLNGSVMVDVTAPNGIIRHAIEGVDEGS